MEEIHYILYGSSFLWNLDRWIKAWIKLYGHHSSPGNIIMHSRMRLIFMVVFVFVSLSFLSRGHDLESVKDREGSSFFFFMGQYDLWRQHTSKLFSPFTSFALLTPHSLSFLLLSLPLSFCPFTLLWDVPQHIIPSPRGFCNWPCYTVTMAAKFTAVPQDLSQHFIAGINISLKACIYCFLGLPT